MGWGDVGVVATNGGADMSLVRNEVIGRIKANPAEVRHQDVDPGMAGVRSGAVVVFAAAIEVAGDVSRRDADEAQAERSWCERNPGRLRVRLVMASSMGESTRVERGTYSKYSNRR